MPRSWVDDFQSWTQIAPPSAIDGLTTCTTHRAAKNKTVVLLFLFIFLNNKVGLGPLRTAQYGSTDTSNRCGGAVNLSQSVTCSTRVYELMVMETRRRRGLFQFSGRPCVRQGCTWTLNIYTTCISWYTTPYHFRGCHKHHIDAQLGRIWCSSIIVIIPFFNNYYYY